MVRRFEPPKTPLAHGPVMNVFEKIKFMCPCINFRIEKRTRRLGTKLQTSLRLIRFECFFFFLLFTDGLQRT